VKELSGLSTGKPAERIADSREEIEVFNSPKIEEIEVFNSS